MIGMALCGLTRGRLSLKAQIPTASKQIHSTELNSPEALHLIEAMNRASAENRLLHDALLSVRGWREIPFDGRLLITQQDALLIGGKVQAMPGFADHVSFRDRELCAACIVKTCVAMCSGQAITEGPDGQPIFEREKCVHCGACLWNCANAPDNSSSNIEFRAGSGGLHSAEN